MSSIVNWLLSVLYSLPAVFVAFTFHEYCHARVAVWLGDDTPRLQGRLTLDPLVHVDPVGLLMLILLGFGWAKPVQVNVRNFKNPKRDDLLVSFAGVAGNLLLAFLAELVLMLVWVEIGWQNLIFYRLMSPVVSLNLVLCVFNLLPIPPLDGWRVLKTLLPYRYWARLLNFERYGFVLLMMLSMLGVLSGVVGTVTGFMQAGIDALVGLILPHM